MHPHPQNLGLSTIVGAEPAHRNQAFAILGHEKTGAAWAAGRSSGTLGSRCLPDVGQRAERPQNRSIARVEIPDGCGLS
jgi:hypothetical protein